MADFLDNLLRTKTRQDYFDKLFSETKYAPAREKKTGRFVSKDYLLEMLRTKRDTRKTLLEDLGLDRRDWKITPPRNRPNDLLKMKFPNWKDMQPHELRNLVVHYYKRNRWKHIESRTELVDWTLSELIKDSDYRSV